MQLQETMNDIKYVELVGIKADCRHGMDLLPSSPDQLFPFHHPSQSFSFVCCRVLTWDWRKRVILRKEWKAFDNVQVKMKPGESWWHQHLFWGAGIMGVSLWHHIFRQLATCKPGQLAILFVPTVCMHFYSGALELL